MNLKKKIAATLSALLLASSSCFAASTTDIMTAVTALISAQKNGSNNKMQDLLSVAMLMNGGIQLADGVKYSWIDSGEVKSFVQCSLSTLKPQLNQEVEAVCSIVITDKKYAAAPVPLQITQTMSSVGKNTMSGMFYINKIAEEKEDGTLVGTGSTHAGSTFVTITIEDVKDSTTTLSAADDKSNWMMAVDPLTGLQTTSISGTDPEVIPEIDNNKYFDSGNARLADDGTNSGPANPPEGGGSGVPDGYGDDPDTPNGGTLPSVDTGNGYTNLYDNNNGNDIADYLNRALDDLDSFNSGEDDWKGSSSGNDGEASLDDYFGGIDEEDADAPGGLTDDLLGLGTSIYDEDNLGEGQEPQQEYAVVENLPAAETAQTDGEGGFIVSDDASDAQAGENGFKDLSSVYQQGLAGLDGVANNGDSSNGGLLGSMSARDGSSLSRRLQRLANGDVSVVNNSTATASDQELFDLAKKELTGAGISLEDIKKGLTYSPNSAWTDPAIAWDFNRITTLMKKKKISLQPTASQRAQESANRK